VLNRPVNLLLHGKGLLTTPSPITINQLMPVTKKKMATKVVKMKLKRRQIGLTRS
jgi:hypothetical protein